MFQKEPLFGANPVSLEAQQKKPLFGGAPIQPNNPFGANQQSQQAPLFGGSQQQAPLFGGQGTFGGSSLFKPSQTQ